MCVSDTGFWLFGSSQGAFIHLLNKYLFRASHVPSTIFDPRDSVVCEIVVTSAIIERRVQDEDHH